MTLRELQSDCDDMSAKAPSLELENGILAFPDQDIHCFSHFSREYVVERQHTSVEGLGKVVFVAMRPSDREEGALQSLSCASYQVFVGV